MAASNAVWTEPMDAMRRDMWAQGASGTQIANALSAAFRVDITKNAVCGRNNRMRDITRRGTCIKYTDGPRSRAAEIAREERRKADAYRASLLAAERRREQEAAVAALPVVLTVFKIRDPGRCSYPLWGDNERPTHRFCEATATDANSVYCAEHRALCYRPWDPPKRREAA